MPSSTPKQARFMAAAAHNPQFAKSAGVPQSVAQEFNAADIGKKMIKQRLLAQTVRSAGRKNG